MHLEGKGPGAIFEDCGSGVRELGEEVTQEYSD
jgi:hypothetical protein